MKSLSIVIALVLSLSVATGAVANSKNNSDRKSFDKGWIEITSCGC